MYIPDPDEFEHSISILLDNVDRRSMLGNVLYNITEPGKLPQKSILLPAPLYFRYGSEEWWSINTKQRYDKFIPWHRQAKNWPIYPVLNDILAIELRKRVRFTPVSFN